ncbi:glutamate racemase [Acidaminococcus fermentans DSM 20731]|mgnify:FL=1|uniref:Glutamate racemase n=3 Tax=Acidaminococcus fermentans TaxID=905 RepID=D2RM08_ACIFV|nr:glutamate racemase [Acidaminococcus fermentans]ADB48110.1 glutamate racemase [Acidaminococcus fermentans DSM 20731]MCI7195457.1 glutamate racemase [Acidaminococcus fermentans]MDY4146666.1 glutamate racemase [Acidaminococcus fermentans]MEE0339524.1 glutamate racemase [Acidaminococcus fermentans]UEA73323.1 glutamate racemase [Acidaminococcus fermentans DSM 20731]
MMQAKQPIGVIDSGVGGLTVLKWLQAKLPHEDFIFIGDTARTPYGNRSREEITRFVAEMTDWLDKRHIKQLVVACNTITVLGLDVIKGNHPFDVIGMAKGSRMVPGVTKNNRVGFFATDFTVSTGAHKREIQRICPEIQVFGQGCPKFVPLIEGEKFGSPELKAAIHEYADKLREHNVDTVLLSCTHYPFVRKEIEEEFGPEVTILDPAERTTQDALENLEKRGLARTTGLGRAEICFTADLERGRRLAARMLDLSKCGFHLIDLQKDPEQPEQEGRTA